MEPHEVDLLNRSITGDYRRLSEQMRRFLGIDYLDWCGFAAWSSHTIGASIGDIGRPDNAFHSLPFGARLLTRIVRRYLRGGDGIGRLVDGNIAIYTEMRAVYEAIISSDPTLDVEHRMEAVLAAAGPSMIASNPPTDAEWASVREASRCYLLTVTPGDEGPGGDEVRRRELVLAAAVHFSAFEQARVDAMLDEFMYSPTRRLRSRLPGWFPGDFGNPRRRTVCESVSAWFFTRFLTILVTASGSIHLGKRFVVPDPGAYGMGRNPLVTISAVEAREALEAHGDEVRPDIADWSAFEQRMRVIVAYFRSYQHVAAMVDFERLPPPPEVSPEVPGAGQ